MKIKVSIDNHIYTVNVGDTKARPIIVEVDGDVFEVWPETIEKGDITPPNESITAIPQEIQRPHTIMLEDPTRAAKSGISKLTDITPMGSKIIRAPIPGVITAINVTVGCEISVDEELLKLEAMKMNNSIRSNRAGVIKSIFVSVGQIVKLNEELIELSS